MLGKIKKIRRFVLGKLKAFRLKLRNPNLTIGNGFYCGTGCFSSPKNSINIGNNFYMGNNCHLASNATIGNDVLFASYVSLVGGDHKIDNITVPIRYAGREELKTITICDNVWVGHGAIIMHGVTINSGAVIAAGSIVTKNVEANSIVGGNPAKHIRFRK